MSRPARYRDLYLDYAASTPLLPEVLAEMLPILRNTYGNPDSLHIFGRRAAAPVLDARDRIAGVLGVQASEVYFTSGGTEGDNWAVRCMGRGEAVVSAIEHAAVLAAAPLREGGSRTCPVPDTGCVSLTDLEGTMSKDTGLVAVMGVNNETGCIQPIREIANFAHAHGALFFTDCVQAACTQDLAGIASFSDGLSLSAHKIGGPKGVGALIVKKDVPLRPLLIGGEQERGLRGGTLNVAGIVGFAAALEIAAKRRREFSEHTGQIRSLFESRLAVKLGNGVRFDGENRAPNISHVTFFGGEKSLLARLDLEGISASGGAACSAHAARPSHVMLAMGRTEEEAQQGIRFSFSLATKADEILHVADKLVSLLS